MMASEKRRAYMRRYQARHRGRIRQMQADYRQRNATDIAAKRALPEQREAARQRARAWYYAHRERAMKNVRRYQRQHRPHCAFCGRFHHHRADSCLNCAQLFGRFCRDNSLCGVHGHHKHCPCGEPILTGCSSGMRIQPCGLCRREMLRLGVSLPDLFRLNSDLNEERSDVAA